MKKALPGLLALMWALALPAKDFAALDAEMLAAYRAKDYVAAEAALSAQLALRPDFPRALYNRAALHALQGRTEAALVDLQRLADMRLFYKPQDDADFTALKDEARFTALVQQFTRNGEPQGRAQFELRSGQTTFLPEAVAYSRDTRSFYLGSVHQRRILEITSADQRFNLVEPARAGLWSVLGLRVDPLSTARRIWASSAALPVMDGFEPEQRGRSGIFGFDLESGRLRAKFLLPEDGREHVLGDLIVSRGQDGWIYTTDAATGTLYRVHRSKGGFAALNKPGSLISPQGLTFDAKEQRIYLADDAQGIFVYDLQSETLTRLPAPPTVSVYGIEGLAFHKNTLIAVQNGLRPHRVVRLRLDENGSAITGAQVLVANHAEFETPTKGMVYRNRFYFVANSQRNRIKPDHTLPPPEQLRQPVVLRIELEE